MQFPLNFGLFLQTFPGPHHHNKRIICFCLDLVHFLLHFLQLGKSGSPISIDHKNPFPYGTKYTRSYSSSFSSIFGVLYYVQFCIQLFCFEEGHLACAVLWAIVYDDDFIRYFVFLQISYWLRQHYWQTLLFIVAGNDQT